MEIMVSKNASPAQKPQDESNLGFGKLFTDHMFIMDYDEGQGWHSPRVTPRVPFVLDPATSVFHYGQAIFEGLKAYRDENDNVRLFRPMENIKRMNRSAARMCIPEMPEDVAYEGLKQLVKLDADWVPRAEGTSLYIRPTIIAVEPVLGVKAASKYIFFIILSPSGAYYATGLEPVKIYVEDEYVRAVRGGIGFTKAAANYAASLMAGEVAKKKGFAQVLWLDGIEQKYIEEVGSMNMFFLLDGALKTPALNGSILPGITRDSILKLAQSMGIPASEERIALDDVIAAAKNGKMTEAFGAGTAAVVSPVGAFGVHDELYTVGDGKTGAIAKKLYDTLTGIQYGRLPDPFGWSVVL